MGKRTFTLVERQRIERLLAAGAELGIEAALLSAGGTVSLLRRYLGMTQEQLARRAGVAQSYLARVESEAVQPGSEVLARIFSALFCRFALVPIPLKPLDEVIDRQAQQAAESHVRYLAGTMALEEQKPDPKTLKQLVEEEKMRLKLGRSSRIWEE